MAYTDSPQAQDHLRKLISEDLSAKNDRRSAAAIIRAVNQRLGKEGRANEVIQEIENTEHYIRDFAKGKPWRDERIKRLIWEQYVQKKQLILISRGEAVDEDVARVFEYTFQRGSNAAQSLDRIIGQFFLYKRAIKDPSKLVLRAFVEFKLLPSNQLLQSGVLQIDELHINRSHLDRATSSDQHAEPVTESWAGTLMPRERCYSAITYESQKGTPKFLVLEVLHEENRRAHSLRGHSVESIEGWGPGQLLHSPVYLERIGEHVESPTSDRRFDLITLKELRKSNQYVIGYLGL